PMTTPEDLWRPVQALLQHLELRRPVGRVQLRLSGFCPALSRQMDLLARQDSRLEDIARQLSILGETHGPALVRVPALLASSLTPGAIVPLLEERRHRWLDPIEVINGRSRPTPARRRVRSRR
ncbi:MAG: hypothetical protein ABR573_02000, partial [Candidatus Dormibacteria bacterium]